MTTFTSITHRNLVNLKGIVNDRTNRESLWYKENLKTSKKRFGRNMFVMKYIIELNEKSEGNYHDRGVGDKCESICKRHFLKDGWICEKCGLRRYDYDQKKKWFVKNVELI